MPAIQQILLLIGGLCFAPAIIISTLAGLRENFLETVDGKSRPIGQAANYMTWWACALAGAGFVFLALGACIAFIFVWIGLLIMGVSLWRGGRNGLSLRRTFNEAARFFAEAKAVERDKPPIREYAPEPALLASHAKYNLGFFLGTGGLALALWWSGFRGLSGAPLFWLLGVAAVVTGLVAGLGYWNGRRSTMRAARLRE